MEQFLSPRTTPGWSSPWSSSISLQALFHSLVWEQCQLQWCPQQTPLYCQLRQCLLETSTNWSSDKGSVKQSWKFDLICYVKICVNKVKCFFAAKVSYLGQWEWDHVGDEDRNLCCRRHGHIHGSHHPHHLRTLGSLLWPRLRHSLSSAALCCSLPWVVQHLWITLLLLPRSFYSVNMFSLRIFSWNVNAQDIWRREIDWTASTRIFPWVWATISRRGK